MPELNTLIGVRASARQLGVHENTVRHMINDGRIPEALQVNGHWKVPLVVVERLRVELTADELLWAMDQLREAMTTLQVASARATRVLEALNTVLVDEDE